MTSVSLVCIDEVLSFLADDATSKLWQAKATSYPSSKFNSVPCLFRGDNSRADRDFPPDIERLRCVSGSPCTTRTATGARARHPCRQFGQYSRSSLAPRANHLPSSTRPQSSQPPITMATSHTLTLPYSNATYYGTHRT
ncbi:hypothetical protein BGW80DRAFT_1302052 [Lactifluus volemus]|nr:hypothetical protein BGW80DRAFT_1302052 [Lactifluus volemus]